MYNNPLLRVEREATGTSSKRGYLQIGCRRNRRLFGSGPLCRCGSRSYHTYRYQNRCRAASSFVHRPSQNTVRPLCLSSFNHSLGIIFCVALYQSVFILKQQRFSGIASARMIFAAINGADREKKSRFCGVARTTNRLHEPPRFRQTRAAEQSRIER